MTKKICFILMMVFCLAGCITGQQYATMPPPVSQIQGQCMAMFHGFLDQTTCIHGNISSYPHAQPNPFTQEYIAYMHSLSEKVKAKKISGDDARVELIQRLNNLRQRQNREFAQQEALSNQRAAQVQQILKQNKIKPLELYEMKTTPVPTQTNCYVYGNQVNCLSQN